MAISYSTSASSVASGVTSTGLSITTVSGNTRLIAAAKTEGSNGITVTATFNSVSMTQITTLELGNSGGTYHKLHVFELINPSIGAYSVSFSFSGNINVSLVAASYTGDDTSRSITNFTSNTGRTISHTSINGWAILLAGSANTGGGDDTMTASTNSTLRVASGNTGNKGISGLFDSNAQVNGVYAMSYDSSGAINGGVVVTIPIQISTEQNDVQSITDIYSSDVDATYSDNLTISENISSPTWANARKNTKTITNQQKS